MEKVVFSTRLPKTLTEALESAKWELKMPKGKIVEEAIKEYLKKHCPQVYEEYLSEQKD